MKNLIPNKRVVINPHYEMVANKKRKELFPYRFLKGWMPIILSGKKASCRTVYDLLCKRTKPTIFLPFTYFRLSWVSTAAQAFLWLWWVVGCSLAVVQGLLIRWLPLVRSTGAVVGAHGLNCSATCGILPDQGLNPRLLHWQADSSPLSRQGSRCMFLMYA